MQIGQPVAGVGPVGTASANRIGSMRCTIAAPSAPTWISPPELVYGTSPVWKFGAVYVPVHSVKLVEVMASVSPLATGAGVPNTPLRIAGAMNVACWVVNTAAETTSARSSSPG